MNMRSPFALLAAAVVLTMCAATNISCAAPLSRAAVSLASSETSSVTKVEYGCGWDYACPPRPWYGRRSHHTPQVYIENNYGTVNVYLHRRRHHYHPSYYDRPSRWSEGRYEDWRYKRCEGDSCEESCGVFCWFRRIRKGYCGHGCEVYREHVRYERDYRLYEYPRPYVYRDPPPGDYGYDAPVHFERPSEDERVPLRRFEGPKYPPNCTDGDC